MNGAAYASRLPDGNTLITDAGNNRIVEVDPTGAAVFVYDTNLRAGSVGTPNPTRAIRTFLGDTLISDQLNHQVIKIDPQTTNIVFSLGTIGVSGAGATQLKAPYDAKVIGDFTGQTDAEHFSW